MLCASTKEFSSDIEKVLTFTRKTNTPIRKKTFIKVLKKLGDEKKKLPNEMDVAVSSKLKNVGYEGPLD